MEHMDSTPLTSTRIKVTTDQDPVLSAVRRQVQEAWPTNDADDRPDLQRYVQRRYELSTEGGLCVVGEWGCGTGKGT